MTAALLIIAAAGWLWGLAEWVRANGAEDQRDEAWEWVAAAEGEINRLRCAAHPATRQIAERPRLEVVRGEGR